MNSEDAAGMFEVSQSRGRFLRQLGMIAAAGAAAVLLPGRALADGAPGGRHHHDPNAVCCPASPACRTCSTGQQSFNCADSCSGARCCVCLGPSSDCIVVPCGICE